MADGLNLLTADWFFIKGVTGVCVGYVLRVLEHIIWSRKVAREQNPFGICWFALMILPQSVLFGLALGYMLLAVMAYTLKNETVLANSAYLLTALMAFAAVDLRELVRRISRW
jgi:hypothetical protein